LLYIVALSEYDQQLEETKTKVMRMHESLRLFEEMISNVWFCNTPVMLLLNKRDLFAAKIQTKDLSCCFPDYTG
jgi:hypothetical protein